MGHRWRRATFSMAGAGGRAARQGRAGGQDRARQGGTAGQGPSVPPSVLQGRAGGRAGAK
jgi:hypothetical protein